MYDETFLEDTLRYAFKNAEFYNVPKGIIRFDYSKDHGWWVRVSRDRAQFKKFFSDGKHGTIDEALKQAILYRHEILSSFPITLKKISNRGLPLEPEKRIKRCVEKGKLQPYIYWQARWYNKDHKIMFKPFSVRKFGEEEAKALALATARELHNKKAKLSKVSDPYLKPAYKALSRADIAIWSTISDKQQYSSKKEKEEITNNDPFAFEGERKLELHKSIERDQKFRNQKVALFLKEHGKIFCELCLFNFIETYSFLSTDIIEVHHMVPLASLSKKTKITFKDLMLLCSNCHFAIHQGDAEENLLLAMDYFENIK